MFPENLKYMKSHEWVRVEGSKATFGVTKHAVEEIRDIIFLELNSVGQEITQGKPFGTIESVKAVFELFAPLSGKVTAVNQVVLDKPETLNEDAYQKGWLMEVELKNSAELSTLMDAKAYEEFLKTEGAGH